MLRRVDDTLQALLEQTWRPPPARPDILFDPPDGDTWKNRVTASNTVKLNVYLIDVRENPNFRRSSWDVEPGPNNTTTLSRPPAYIDCHYMVSAWSPAQNEATKIEHAVLAGALRVFLQNPDVLPVLLGTTGEGPVFDLGHIYLLAAPSETSRALSDFWTSMKQPWRPAIQLIATAPLDLLQDGPPDARLLTLVLRFADAGSGGRFEETIDIFGLVLRAADDTAIAGAVVIRVANGIRTQTDDDGRFTFVRVSRGIHRIRVEATGFAPMERDLDVPGGPAADHIFRFA